MARIERTIEVEAPVARVYEQWTQFEAFPEFMEGVEAVERIDDRRLHWRASVAGRTEEWDAEIVEQVEEETIAWRSVSGAQNAGRVTFAGLDPVRTHVTLHLDYEPEGVVESAGDALGLVSRRVEGDLERFKAMLESRTAVPGHDEGEWRGVGHISTDE